MVNVAVLMLVQVPLMTPVVVFSESPAGSTPLLTAKRYGAVPPVAVNVRV
jgi:hypothetical protein